MTHPFQTLAAPSESIAPHERLGFSRERLAGVLRGMIQARAVDDRLWQLSRQGSVHFVITSAGHEATQFGCALAVNVGRDYVVPYYRDLALCMALGQTPLEMLLHGLGRQGDTASGARQMFGHFSSRARRIVSGSSSTGSHIVHAAGLALAFKLTGEQDIAAITFFGEGSTAEGAWHEGINFAGIHQLPLVLVCENNRYAISVPVRLESPVEDIAQKAAGYGMPGVTVDGNDLFAVYEAAKTAMDRARAGGGPTLLECKTYRLRPHSNADDDRKYRSAEEVEAWRARDPILRLGNYMLEHELLSEYELAEMRSGVAAEVDEATRLAEEAPNPPRASLGEHLYADADIKN